MQFAAHGRVGRGQRDQARRDFPCSRNRWLESASRESSQRWLFTREGREICLRCYVVLAVMPRSCGCVFDGGFADKAEAQLRHPSGDTIFQTLCHSPNNGKNVISKAWDNRYGVLIVSGWLEPCLVTRQPTLCRRRVQERGGPAWCPCFNDKICTWSSGGLSPAGGIYGGQRPSATERDPFL